MKSYLGAEIFKLIQKLQKEENLSILLVEQNARATLSLADYGYVLENGRIVLYGTGNELRENKEACVAGTANSKDCKRIIDVCLRKFGKINVLYNNVGIPSWVEVVDTKEEMWTKTFDFNIKGMFLMCQ